MENIHISKLMQVIEELTLQHMGEDSIYPSEEGHRFYIQPPKRNAPMLLNHYRGGYFVDMHPEDYRSIVSGEIAPKEYVYSANWQVGYYWGRGSIFGGFYQPMDIVHDKEKIRRYLQILNCRGFNMASGYMPSMSNCMNCFVRECPMSCIRIRRTAWKEESIMEQDPRKDLLDALCRRLEKEHSGVIKNLYCGTIPSKEVWLSDDGFYNFFTAYVSSGLIQSLLMKETIPKDWDAYVANLKFVFQVS